jgi:hypothetical protein
MSSFSELCRKIQIISITITSKFFRAHYSKLDMVISKQDFYLGIPYAKPPVGSLRFGRPEPFEDPAWDGVLEFKSNGPSCYQTSRLF